MLIIANTTDNSYSQRIKLNIGVSFDRTELDEICNFFISSEMSRISTAEYNELQSSKMCGYNLRRTIRECHYITRDKSR
jgi:hypothetical protein